MSKLPKLGELRIASTTPRELGAEFAGTMVLVMFATGISGAGELFQAWSSFTELAFISGLGVALAIYIAAPNSEAHLNPAITLAMTVWRGFPAAKVLPYILAQLAGALSGAGLTYALYHNTVQASRQTGQEVGQFLFTQAAPYLSQSQALVVELTLTAFLALVIFAVSDPNNSSLPRGNWGPLIIGLTVALLGSSFGTLTGFAMNPARDLGPRLWAGAMGYGQAAFNSTYYLVPIIGPSLGALAGGFLYEKTLKGQLSRTTV